MMSGGVRRAMAGQIRMDPNVDRHAPSPSPADVQGGWMAIVWMAATKCGPPWSRVHPAAATRPNAAIDQMGQLLGHLGAKCAAAGTTAEINSPFVGFETQPSTSSCTAPHHHSTPFTYFLLLDCLTQSPQSTNTSLNSKCTSPPRPCSWIALSRLLYRSACVYLDTSVTPTSR